jgi:kynurenine formamidase
MRVINLSHPITPEFAVLPEPSPVEVTVIDSQEQELLSASGSFPTAKISIALHNGTYISAPFRFLEGSLTIDQVPLERCMGTARILRLPCTPQQVIQVEDLMRFAPLVTGCTVLLFYTRWAERWGQNTYFEEHPSLSLEAADLILSWGIHLLGIDFPMLDYYPFPAFVRLLKHNVLVVQNLTNLEMLVANKVDFLAIPLRILNGEGSPVRAIAIDPD